MKIAINPHDVAQVKCVHDARHTVLQTQCTGGIARKVNCDEDASYTGLIT